MALYWRRGATFSSSIISPMSSLHSAYSLCFVNYLYITNQLVNQTGDFGSCRIEYYYSTGAWYAYGPTGQIV